MKSILMNLSISKNIILFLAGLIAGTVFAPIYFSLGLFAFSILAYQLKNSQSRKQAAVCAYVFGCGFFLVTLYWISFSIFVYIEEFWWVFPLALLGLPMFLALFIALFGICVFAVKDHILYHFVFCVLWVLIEWVMSWILTGFPWAMLGYGFAFSIILSQTASLFGVLGLSFVAVYIGSIFYERRQLFLRLMVSVLILIMMISFGKNRLAENVTEYGNLRIRIIQPSIIQSSKWNPKEFWTNLEKQVELSKINIPLQKLIPNPRLNMLDLILGSSITSGSQAIGERASENRSVHKVHEDLSSETTKQLAAEIPDIIIWPESALTVPYNNPVIMNYLQKVFSKNKQYLITGGISVEGFDENYKLYSSMLALDANINKEFAYHKSHLVPFGEYVPLKGLIPVKKITDGIIDYTKGERRIVEIKDLALKIKPLICYESIFPSEVMINNREADLIINITNDAWYGNSSGPYQHFAISRMRAIENGLPMARAANKGISAIIDPVGRIISQLALKDISFIENNIPNKLHQPTFFSVFGVKSIIILVISVLFLQLIVNLIISKCKSLSRDFRL